MDAYIEEIIRKTLTFLSEKDVFENSDWYIENWRATSYIYIHAGRQEVAKSN